MSSRLTMRRMEKREKREKEREKGNIGKWTPLAPGRVMMVLGTEIGEGDSITTNKDTFTFLHRG